MPLPCTAKAARMVFDEVVQGK